MKHLKTFENFSNTDINEEIDFKALAQKIGLIKDPVEKRAKIVKALSDGSSVHSKKYKFWMEKNTPEGREVADKLVDFLVKNSGFFASDDYITWVPAKKAWIDAGHDTSLPIAPGS